jgi:cytochrome b involved in lipid metabolism
LRFPGFVDEHPGGEEVLLDVGGQDSTEAFEDVGHSDEAREILEGLLVGNLKRGVRIFNPILPTLSANQTIPTRPLL